MSTDYNYDEQGQFFPFFILTISGLVTLPLTYSLLKPSKDLENTAPRIHSDFKPPHADLIEGQKRKQRRRERKLKRIITVITGWLVMGWMIYLIMVTARTVPKIWDPYDILGISRSANEKAIKSHYKRLSLKHHPDKIRPDPSRNETAESLNDQFVELTKAYKALTDEEVRNNYVQYGHPDGKQSMSIGIALPKFIITEGNGKYVLLVYGLLLGVLLPYVVGKWWYGTQTMTKERVLVASAGNLFREYEDALSEGGAVGTLSAGEEYKGALKGAKGEHEIDKIEDRVLRDPSAGVSPALTAKDRAKLERLDGGVRRKVLGLLWAYLGRVDLKDATLNDERFEVAPIALALNESLLAISLAYGNVAPILSSFHTSQNLIQALLPNASPLLQLPHMTPSIVQAIEGSGAKTHLTVQEFMRMRDDKRRKLATGPGLLSKNQYATAISIGGQMPVLKVEKAFFKVTGERFITPSSLVQFVIKARVIPPGSTNVPKVNELDLEDVDPDEGDLDALLGRKRSSRKMTQKGGPSAAAASAADEKAIQPPLAFAPYFPRDHSPRWHVFLADGKQGKMAVPPFTFTSFDKPLYHEHDHNKEDKADAAATATGSTPSSPRASPTFAMQTLKMQFQAPPQAGQYTFVMHLICDSYVGTDTKMEVTLKVEEMGRAEEMMGEDEISEPDEDSLAGQMSALKSGGGSTSNTGKNNKKKAKKLSTTKQGDNSESDDESDDESESDSEEDDEDGKKDQGEGSETDTDTESEE